MELIEFLHQTQREIREEMAARAAEPGEAIPFAELVFTEVVTRHMSDIGMTFEPQICHYSAKIGSANLRLSGYAISDDSDQLDLYVSLYEGADEIASIPDSDITKAVEQCIRFLGMCVNGKLASKMDESSDAYPLVLTIETTYVDLDQIRIYVLTDRKVKTKKFKTRTIQEKIVNLEALYTTKLLTP
jgi:hypothetical protein